MTHMLFIKRIILILILAVSVHAIAASIHNRGTEIVINDHRLIDQELVSRMLDWIGKNGPYKKFPNQTVDIRLANQQFMNNQWKRGGGESGFTVYAFTSVNITTRKIIMYLPIDFDWSGYRGRTQLIHELVHVQQYMYRMDYRVDCVANLEHEAYMMALVWFKEQKIDDEFFVKDRNKWLDIYADCD